MRRNLGAALIAKVREIIAAYRRRAAIKEAERNRGVDAEWQNYFRQGCHDQNGEFAVLMRRHHVYPPV